ncbi:hypothetical protein L228DRAFT_156401 [Xylona heveae TC161]|uniref:Uncharacterized protein n=1 Tax=Xylona heveae (strain CBS 132557 / TC161) TaxID=1328760 RepID=A0A165G0U0_XYLHT|nr:hypothetical protein L228DRAFT_156401 [Xylona heveae TC161]KZF21607.1 hypothetical protein L228DRAFT_156401 [Xylona heveae TC161]
MSHSFTTGISGRQSPPYEVVTEWRDARSIQQRHHELDREISREQRPLRNASGNYGIRDDEQDSETASSKINNAVTVCKWAVGWRVPFIITASYFLALVIAFAHLIFFRYLNGKRVDDLPNLPQTYVTTVSTIMANMFAILIQGSLAAAFVQHLWRQIRKAPLEVCRLERLFTLRSNPLSFFDIHIYRNYFVLAIMAIIIWFCPVVTSFPPGALKVSSGPYDLFSNGSIPTLSLSNYGNGSISDMEKNAFFSYVPTKYANGSIYIQLDHESGLSIYQATQNLASKVTFNMDMDILISPCGPNCSFSDSFEGPFLDCSQTTHDIMVLPLEEPEITAYSARWTDYTRDETDAEFPGFHTTVPMTFETYNLTTCYNNANNTYGNIIQNLTRITLSCLPKRAIWDVNYNFDRNGAQHVEVKTRDIIPLADLSQSFLISNYTGDMLTIPAYKLLPLTPQFRDANIATILYSMVALLAGDIAANAWCPGNNYPPGQYGDSTWSPEYESPFLQTAGVLLNTSIVPFTRFSALSPYATDYLAYNATNLFNITQAGLNSLLQNITLSYMFMLSPFSKQMQLKQTVFENYYYFTHPLNLILPYFITLAVALPLLLLGLKSLFVNGVPATDGGFLQLLATTRGSEKLDQLAARGCLGEELNFPTELKKTKVMFGEFLTDRISCIDADHKIGNDAENAMLPKTRIAYVRYGEIGEDEEGQTQQLGVVRRAGFGTEDEVVPLVKGRLYGGGYQDTTP